MTSRFKSWNGEVLCKNVSLIDAGPSVEENTILFIEAQDRMKKRPMTSLFKAWNEEVLCKIVSLIDAGPGVEEHTILFMEAQDRASVEEQTILIMEAQDHIKKRPLFKMAQLGLRDSISGQ
ncbi:hypothetical protein Tco_0859862 [Tanacetum coccineum]|uniref:Uncharacterized protein n=1 Tax=Tanacetum coccineum TaxID=301880 RepID=A0ABQ5BD91_9ASTR